MNLKISTTICILIFLSSIIYAQPFTLRLWTDSVPGSKKSVDYIEHKYKPWGITDCIEKISNPEIIVYLPPVNNVTCTAVLIIPGGGYNYVAMEHEGTYIANWLNNNGIAGIVLKYRLPSDKIMKEKKIGPLQDAQEAMRLIRRNASQWGINPKMVGVMGFSAGGHLAATLSTHYKEKVYDVKDSISARPDFSILVYPLISFNSAITHLSTRQNLLGNNPTNSEIKHYSIELQTTKETPPTFLVHSTNDDAVSVLHSILYFESLHKYKIPTELHIYQNGGHGYGLALNGGTESAWPKTCLLWLKSLQL